MMFKSHLSNFKLLVTTMFVAATLASCSQAPNQDPKTELDYLTRDVRDDVFYFVMPDRFDNGDVSNDHGDQNIPISYGGFDPSSKGHYHGGDLKGLINQLDYLQDMGL